jgi:glycosyltransferase involved in cell wall biosynthesis
MSTRPVALVTHRYAPAIGGVERTVEALARGLAQRGVSVEVVTTDPTGQLPIREERDGVLVRRFPTLANDAVYYLAPRLGAWLWRNAARFALIHAHSYHTPLALQAAIASRRSGTPLLLSPYYHGTGHSPLRRMLHVPYRLAGYWLVKQARRLIYISKTERALFERHFGSGTPQIVAPCGVEIEQLLAARPHQQAADRTIVLAVGRLDAYKQTDRLIEALPGLPPQYQMVVIGNGPLRARLEQLAAQHGQQARLRLLDHVSQPELLSWYRRADVFVSLSRRESFGLALLEGAAAGAAVVASDIAAHREVATFLPAGRVTFVAPDCSAADLSDALEYAARSGRAASASWPLPTWDGMVEAVAACYQELLGPGWIGPSSRLHSRLESEAA